MRVGIQVGMRVSMGAGVDIGRVEGISGVTRDATSLKYAPSSAAEWTAFSAASGLDVDAPSNLWLLQESSGSLADSVGSNPLTVTGSPVYRKAVAGWNRRAIGASGAPANQFAENTAMENIDTSSVMFLVYALIAPPTAGHQRVFHGAASTNAWEALGGGTLIRLRTGINASSGVSTHGAQVRPYVVVYNRTNSLNIIYSDIEKRSVAYAAAVGRVFRITFGLATDAAVDTQTLYAASWSGAAAELGNAAATDAAVKALLQALGFPVTGY